MKQKLLSSSWSPFVVSLLDHDTMCTQSIESIFFIDDPYPSIYVGVVNLVLIINFWASNIEAHSFLLICNRHIHLKLASTIINFNKASRCLCASITKRQGQLWWFPRIFLPHSWGVNYVYSCDQLSSTFIRSGCEIFLFLFKGYVIISQHRFCLLCHGACMIS